MKKIRSPYHQRPGSSRQMASPSREIAGPSRQIASSSCQMVGWSRQTRVPSRQMAKSLAILSLPCAVDIEEPELTVVEESPTYSDIKLYKLGVENVHKEEMENEDGDSLFDALPNWENIRKCLLCFPGPKGKELDEKQPKIIYGEYTSADKKIMVSEKKENIIIRNAQPMYIIPAPEEKKKPKLRMRRFIVRILISFLIGFMFSLSIILTITSNGFLLIPCGLIIHGLVGYVLFDWVSIKKLNPHSAKISE